MTEQTPPIEQARFLEDGLDFVSRQAREFVLDDLYCRLFNRAGALAGNTEASDLHWFTATLWSHVTGNPASDFDLLADEAQDFYFRTARAALEALPHLMGRVASRMRAQAEVVNALLKAERKKRGNSKENCQDCPYVPGSRSDVG
jgi:hypothetical protein